MSKILILMRHAKSSWSSPGTPDHDRPLNARGRESAAALGGWLRAGGWLPGEVLCSSALRTRETLAGLTIDAPAVFSDALYHAAPDAMRKVLRTATEDRVLMLGHNPGIAEFAEMLLKAPPDHPRFDGYPTGATLVARFDTADWAQLDWGSGEALDFTVPRDLAG